jgi:quinolinate synthetase A subunit
MTLLSLDNIPALQDEVRALAAERGTVVLAHNYQLPEVQQVADYVGDSLGLSRQAAAAPGEVLAFCGVHFMAETASVLSPEKTVLLPDPDAGCSLADSITAEQLRAWKARSPGAPRLLLDNMTPDEVRAAVAQVDGRATIEVSGGVDENTVLVYATISGIHWVSIGALTHSAPVLDLSLILETLP